MPRFNTFTVMMDGLNDCFIMVVQVHGDLISVS